MHISFQNILGIKLLPFYIQSTIYHDLIASVMSISKIYLHFRNNHSTKLTVEKGITSCFHTDLNQFLIYWCVCKCVLKSMQRKAYKEVKLKVFSHNKNKKSETFCQMKVKIKKNFLRQYSRDINTYQNLHSIMY